MENLCIKCNKKIKSQAGTAFDSDIIILKIKFFLEQLQQNKNNTDSFEREKETHFFLRKRDQLFCN
jgi:hypothetical protein